LVTLRGEAGKVADETRSQVRVLGFVGDQDTFQQPGEIAVVAHHVVDG